MTQDPARRVVATGFGLATPLGFDVAAVFADTLAGRSGVDRLTAFDPEEFASRNAAEVDSQALDAAVEALPWRSADRVTDMALLAAGDALRQAGWLPPTGGPAEPLPLGVVVGSGNGPTQAHAAGWTRTIPLGPKGFRPTTIPRCMISVVGSQLSLRYQLTGGNYVISAACASSTLAIGHAVRRIRHGYADAMLCGGAESFIERWLYGAWDNLRVMSRRDDPATACRPFDRARDGFVIGEGAGMIVLESLAHAEARGATALGEIIGYGESSDATSMTAPNPVGQRAAMAAALADAAIGVGDVDYINANGTGTVANDGSEAEAIGSLFAGAEPLVSSNKGQFGHMLGASGAVETIMTFQALAAGRLPPNLNLDDPEGALNFVPGKAVASTADIAMKNSFGFGGSNAVLILKRA